MSELISFRNGTKLWSLLQGNGPLIAISNMRNPQNMVKICTTPPMQMASESICFGTVFLAHTQTTITDTISVWLNIWLTK